jgi:tetratricopeptide (TPR) repeat protein
MIPSRLTVWSRCLLAATALGLASPAPARASDVDSLRRQLNHGNPAAALEAAEQLIARDPDQVEAKLVRGLALARMGRTKAALEVFAALTREQPELPEAFNNLAALYAAQGQLEEARQVLLRGLARHPDYALAHENLADLYLAFARLAYAQALRLGGDASRLELKLARIADGQSTQPSPLAGVPPIVRATSACFLTGPVEDAAQQQALEGWLNERGAAAVPTTPTASPGYLVHLPALESREAAESRVEEIRALGISDVALLGPGPLGATVALGVYGAPPLAQRRVAQLRSKGIEARVRALTTAKRETWLRVVPVAGRPLDRQALLSRFPRLNIDPARCKAQ